MSRSDYLFNKADWFSVERHQKEKMNEEISGVEENRLLNTSVEDLCDYFVTKYEINVPVLNEEQISADQQEVKIDVSGDPRRFISNRSRPFYIAGTAVEITVPFDGEGDALNIQPSTYSMNPPMAKIQGQHLILKFEGADLKAENLRSEIDNTLSNIKSNLENLRKNVEPFNSQIRELARGAIENRKNILLANQNLVSALGFPMKERSNAPKTYAAPEVRRKINPTLPPASTAPYKPEPVLAQNDYEHILNVIENMAQVMERSPSAFSSMDEESLRSHFLVQLNGHYEGQATGETFNYEGKTDILIRSEGKNIFIAECKFWGGPKKLLETIDQLQSYSCWRDTKVAIIIFSKRKQFSKILEAIPETIGQHQNFKKEIKKVSETHLKYLFSHRDDSNREMVISVLAFDVPE